MARDHHLSYDHVVEEDYIDMDINSTFLCYTLPSPPRSREFEFQMSSNHLEIDHITSPADELFYKGKLLPLHLPPRLQMVEKLLQNSTTPFHAKPENSSNKNISSNTPTGTPFESCNISPATSCFASGELNPEDYFYECPKEFVESHAKKSWSKKLKLIKQSSLGLKLKASKAYLKSLFSKSACSDETAAVPKAKECSNGHLKSEKKNPFGQIQRATSFMRRIDGEKMVEDECGGHRRSFSGAIRRRSSNKSSSASSSCSSSNSSSFSSVNSRNSGGLYGPQVLKRSSSVNSENECSIQGAIAYCKKSQQQVCARKSVSDVLFVVRI